MIKVNLNYNWWSQIFLHWSGVESYTWREPGHYHAIYTGDGKEYILTPFDQLLHKHTYARNSTSIALAISSMGTGHPKFPPTPEQINAMCKRAAILALEKGWEPDPVFLKKRIMTHAEAASLRDCDPSLVHTLGNGGEAMAKSLGLPHDNYGPQWPDGWPGGTSERWDLHWISPGDKQGSGGFILRDKIAVWMKRLCKA